MKRPWTRAEKWLFVAPLFFASLAGAAWVWQARGPVKWQIRGAQSIRMVEWSPDSESVAIFAEFPNGQPFGATRGSIYDVRLRAKICDLKSPPVAAGQNLWFNWPSFSPDGTRLATGYSDGARGPTKIPNTYSKFSPRRKGDPGFHFNSVGKIAIWNTTSGALIANPLYAPPTEDSFAGFYFSNDGKQLVGYEKPLALFDAASGARLKRIALSKMMSASFNSARTLVAFQASFKAPFEVRDTRSGTSVWKPALVDAGRARWDEDDVLAVTASRPGASQPIKKPNQTRLWLWDAKTRRALPSPPRTQIYRFAFRPKAPLLALVDLGTKPQEMPYQRSELVMWNYRQNRVLWTRELTGAGEISWSRDGKWLCVNSRAANEDSVQILDAQGQVKAKPASKVVYGTSWAPDSKRIAIYSGKDIEILRVAP